MNDNTSPTKATNPQLHTQRFRFPLCPELAVKENARDCCLRPKTPPKRPDPGIYSQSENFSAGQPMTWDSPDITTNLTGGLDETIRATVRNYSADSTAVNTLVQLEYSQFGIGFPRTLSNILKVNLNKAGSAGDSQTVDFLLPSGFKAENNRVSVFVKVIHPHDRNSNNNVGEQSWSASNATAGSTTDFSFQVYNSHNANETFSLSVLESDWGATLSSGSVNLLPGQSSTVTLSVTIPAGANTKAFNVIALDATGGLYGGLFHRFDI